MLGLQQPILWLPLPSLRSPFLFLPLHFGSQTLSFSVSAEQAASPSLSVSKHPLNVSPFKESHPSSVHYVSFGAIKMR